MYTGFSDATVNPPGLSRVALASVRSGTLPSEPSTSRRTCRAPLTQFLRAVFMQLAIRALAAVPKGSGLVGPVLLICALRFTHAPVVQGLATVPQNPIPRFVAPKLSK